ncbi:MAG TPA: electron transfer flavoprotein-ubiquinone oxidoreductase [Blastocatellia bacterium]|nr:electron transfer flavoprotein-ubiquinone oxidoreductase [Blastocatellia bacterium]
MAVERDTLEVDVLFVGAGPANLAGALHLKNLINKHNQAIASGAKQGKKLEDPSVMVIEKGREIGAHVLSGAVLDPSSLKELVPDFLERDCPLEAPVGEDGLLILTQKGKYKSPITPPPLVNHGNYVVSLSKLVKWMAGLVEAAGVDVFPEFPGDALIYDDNRVAGVRLGDKGLDKNGKPKPNYEPGGNILAKVTVLGEGPRGSLTKQVIPRLRLDAGCNPQVYSLGVKEIWEVPSGRFEPGLVYHTLGFPLPSDTYGGGWIYGMKNNLLDIGFVTGLDYRDPLTDPQKNFQKFKTHPYIKSLIEGGKMVGYGGKTITMGGYWSKPKPYAEGLLLTGESAGLLNSQRLKGIHMAIKSGMLAAETIFEALQRDDYSSETLSRYDSKLKSSAIEKELYKVRNFHQGFEGGFWSGMFHTGLQQITGGRGLRARYTGKATHEHMRKLKEYYGTTQPLQKYAELKFDGKFLYDKLGDIYESGTKHDENQPCHLKVADLDICRNRCVEEFGNPCQHFCPASVYEMVEDSEAKHGKTLQINFSNCIHCKTCDIMDPYEIITWVPPEGGGGPNYTQM